VNDFAAGNSGLKPVSLKYDDAAAAPTAAAEDSLSGESASPQTSASSMAGQAFVYGADVPSPALRGDDPVLAAVAELAVHMKAQTPITIALLGGPGSGKSSALAEIVNEALAIAGDAEGAAESSLRPRLALVRIEAADGAQEPAPYVASRVYEALVANGAEAPFASFAREALASLQDVHAVAREAADHLSYAREKLEGERRTLEDVAGRRARLAETVLATPGSRVDSYGRANRSKIEAGLRAFGFEGDLIDAWKEFVRENAQRNGLERLAFCARALWAYRGQTRLMALALVFVLAAWGVSAAEAARPIWVEWMKTNGGAAIGALGGWLDAHASLLSTLAVAAGAIALLCLLVDVWRATRFLNPIFRATALLNMDLEARRRNLDALIDHHTRRVDLLVKEVDAQTRRADEAERRAEGPASSVSPSDDLLAFYGANDGGPQARARFAGEFLDALERIMARSRGEAPRLLVTVDGFERLAPREAAAFAETTGRLLARAGVVVIFSMDEARIAAGFGEEFRVQFARLVQIPVQIAPDSAQQENWIAGLLNDEQSEPRRQVAAPSLAFGSPLSEKETALLKSLAPFVADNPREARRFVNLYHFARACAPTDDANQAALALALVCGECDEDVARGARERAAHAIGAPISEEALASVRALVARLRAKAV